MKKLLTYLGLLIAATACGKLPEAEQIIPQESTIKSELRLIKTVKCSVAGVDALSRPWEAYYNLKYLNTGVVETECGEVSGVINAVRCDLGSLDEIGVSTWFQLGAFFGFKTTIYYISSSPEVSCVESLQ